MSRLDVHRLGLGFLAVGAVCVAARAFAQDTVGSLNGPAFAANSAPNQLPYGAPSYAPNGNPYGFPRPGGPTLSAAAALPPNASPGQFLPPEPASAGSYGPPIGPRPLNYGPLNYGPLSYAPTVLPAPTAPVAPQPSTLCTACEDGSCGACQGLDGGVADCQNCPKFGFTAFQGFDTFRGSPEGSGPSNFGEVTGLNTAIPVYEPWGIGWQLGASYGLYDFSGRPAPAIQTTGAQQQIFVTTGFFRRANHGQRASFGFVHDWMINDNYSQYAVSPTISQWRGQFEWAASDNNSFGLWGTFRDKSYIGNRPDNHNQFRAISQIDAFWHHKYPFGADTWLRVGMPVSKQLAGSGLAGSAIVGATAQVPLNQQLALYANAMYMAPNMAPGPLASSRDAYNVSMGIAWYPGRNARTPTVNGGCWLPYMPLGNNGNFLVDSIHYD